MGKVEKPPVDVRHISKHNADIIEKLKNADWNERLPSGCLTNHENNVAYITDYKTFEDPLDYSFDDYYEFFKLKKATYKEWNRVEFIPYNTKYGIDLEKIIEVLRILHGGYKAKAMSEVILGFIQSTKPIILFMPYKDDYAVFIVAPLMGSDGADLKLEDVTIDETYPFVDPVRVPLYYDLKTQTIGYSYNDKILSVDEFKEEWDRKHKEYEKQLGKPPELKERVDALLQHHFGGWGGKLYALNGYLTILADPTFSEEEKESAKKNAPEMFTWIKRKYDQIFFSELSKSPFYDDLKPLFEINTLLSTLEEELAREPLDSDKIESIMSSLGELSTEYGETVDKYYKELTGKDLGAENIETRALLEYQSKEQIEDQARWLQEQGIEPNSFEKAAMDYYGVEVQEEPPWRRLMDVIKELEKEHGLEVPKDIAIATATEVGIDKPEDLIGELKRDGILYSPAKGLIMRVGRVEPPEVAVPKILHETIMGTMKFMGEKLGCDLSLETLRTNVKYGIATTDRELDQAIDELKRDGILYSPREGVIRRVNCEEKEVVEEEKKEELKKSISFQKILEKHLYLSDIEKKEIYGEIRLGRNWECPYFWFCGIYCPWNIRIAGRESEVCSTYTAIQHLKIDEIEPEDLFRKEEVEQGNNRLDEIVRETLRKAKDEIEKRIEPLEVPEREEIYKNLEAVFKRICLQRGAKSEDLIAYIKDYESRLTELTERVAKGEITKEGAEEIINDDVPPIWIFSKHIEEMREKAMKLKGEEEEKPPKEIPKIEKVKIHGVLKTRYRCPICYRAAPDNFCMVHSDIKAIDLLAAVEPVKEAVIDLTFLDLFKTKYPEKKRWTIGELHDSIGIDVDYAPEFLAKPRIPETYAQYYARELGVEIEGVEKIVPPPPEKFEEVAAEVKIEIEEKIEEHEKIRDIKETIDLFIHRHREMTHPEEFLAHTEDVFALITELSVTEREYYRKKLSGMITLAKEPKKLVIKPREVDLIKRDYSKFLAEGNFPVAGFIDYVLSHRGECMSTAVVDILETLEEVGYDKEKIEILRGWFT